MPEALRVSAARRRDTFANSRASRSSFIRIIPTSAVVSERFFNFLPNFAPQFPKKNVEEARSRSDMVAKRKGQNSLGATPGCDLYEVRPRKSGDGFDLISELFRYGPIWYAGPDAVRNAVAYAKYRSLSRWHRAKIRVLDDSGGVIQTH